MIADTITDSAGATVRRMRIGQATLLHGDAMRLLPTLPAGQCLAPRQHWLRPRWQLMWTPSHPKTRSHGRWALRRR